MSVIKTSKKLGYVPELDGLRAIAVFLVMIAHSNIYFGSNGGVGVDVFFALSGFLITTLILEERDSFGRFNLPYFYVRRFLRLFPALIFLLIITTFIVWFFFSENWQIFLEELVASFFYVYNISWYWDYASQPFILYHMWSLAVEEQFYLWWPLLLLVLLPRLSEKKLTFILLTLGVIIFAFKFFLIKYLFFNSIFMDSIFFGCVLAFLRRNYSLTFFENNLIFFLSIFILLSLSLYDFSFVSSMISQGYRGFFGVLSCIIIINLIENHNIIHRYFFRNKIIVLMGKLSYSLYLWHLVVFVMFRKIDWLEAYENYLLKFILSLLISIISYYLIERKFLKLSKMYFSVNK